MKTRLVILLMLFLSYSLMGQNTLKLNIDKAETKINKEIYVHFSEHLGTCIY